jgi:hypothetical protein
MSNFPASAAPKIVAAVACFVITYALFNGVADLAGVEVYQIAIASLTGGAGAATAGALDDAKTMAAAATHGALVL